MTKFSALEYQRHLHAAVAQMKGATKAEPVRVVCGDAVYEISPEMVAFVDWVPEITPTPNGQSFVRGLGHVRGRTLLMLDMALALGATPAARHKERLIGLKGADIGIVVQLAREDEAREKRCLPFHSLASGEFLALLPQVATAVH